MAPRTSAAARPAAPAHERPRTARPPGWRTLLPVVLVGGLLLLRVVAQGPYDALVREDGPVEWATVLVYLVAAGAAALVVRALLRGGRRVEALLWGVVVLAFLGIASEEVSWGQRIAGFEGPQALVERNKQDEANLHNLLRRHQLHAVYLAVGLYGAGLGRLLVRRHPWTRARAALLAPGPREAWFFGALVAVYGYYELGEPVVARLLGPGHDALSLGVSRLQEVAELSLALGFLLFALGARRAASSAPADPAARGAAGG
ncbi:hypothetical protein [Vallicoccus soli]|uniref:Uncharacterized protein n=1 Tax=Vallicoccus soli TaxID=2339232 RepID=A0A3A3Z3A2_9ACTN|nr:hypothetical protein [Vallicoccus soli]RJK97882.1 hypothetical protein D5H78_02620 [Vallicoccus soli]